MSEALPRLHSAPTMDLDSRKSSWILASILLLVALLSALTAITRLFWFDEICTVTMSRLHSFGDVWAALRNAGDTNPPIYYFITRTSRSLFGEDHFGYRFPSIIGYMGLIACVYFILARRVSRLSALVGTSLLLCTSLASFAYEARPYTLMLFCMSLAVLAWQRLDDSPIYPVVLAVALALTVSLHYYAIYAWPSFAVAEFVAWRFSRRFRIGVWLALVAGALPMIFYAPMIKSLRVYYGDHFWAKSSTTVSRAFSAQSWLFNFGGDSAANIGLLFITGITAIVIYLYILQKRATKVQGQSVQPEIPAGEQALALMLLWGLPIGSEIAAKVTHGGMNVKYMQPAILGGVFIFACIVERVPRAGRALMLLLMLALYVLSQGRDAVKLLHGSLHAQRNQAVRDAAALAALGDQYHLPMVISDPGQFMPMNYYLPDDLKGKLTVVIDPAEAIEATGLKSDSTDLAARKFGHYFPFRVDDYDDFVASHHEFLLLLGGGLTDWWPVRLSSGKFDAELISLGLGTTVYKSSGGGGTAIYRVSVKQ